MTIKHLSYLDLTQQQRTAAANEARQRLKQLAANPFLTPDQQQHLQQERSNITHWEQADGHE